VKNHKHLEIHGNFGLFAVETSWHDNPFTLYSLGIPEIVFEGAFN
jgi:hypothetical protein